MVCRCALHNSCKWSHVLCRLWECSIWEISWWGERTGGYQVSECQTQSLRNFRLRSVRLTGREMENKIWVERRRHRRDSRQHTQLIITQSMQAPISASAQKNFTFYFIIVDLKKSKKLRIISWNKFWKINMISVSAPLDRSLCSLERHSSYAHVINTESTNYFDKKLRRKLGRGWTCNGIFQ